VLAVVVVAMLATIWFLFRFLRRLVARLGCARTAPDVPLEMRP